jgi:glucose PTS system EIICB or EIICBA component
VAALGGPNSIVRVDACAETRLRLVVRDGRRVQEPAPRAEGIAALVSLDSETLHLLPGLNADQDAADMRGLLASGE